MVFLINSCNYFKSHIATWSYFFVYVASHIQSIFGVFEEFMIWLFSYNAFKYCFLLTVAFFIWNRISANSEACRKEPSLFSWEGQHGMAGVFRTQFGPWMAAWMSHEPWEIFICRMKMLMPEHESFDCVTQSLPPRFSSSIRSLGFVRNMVT